MRMSMNRVCIWRLGLAGALALCVAVGCSKKSGKTGGEGRKSAEPARKPSAETDPRPRPRPAVEAPAARFLQKELADRLPAGPGKPLLDAPVIAVTAEAIAVDGQKVDGLKKGRVPADAKRDGPKGYFINGLYNRMKAYRRTLGKNPGPKTKGCPILAVAEDVPYRTVSEVMYTTGQAEFNCFQVAVRSADGKVAALRISTPRVSARNVKPAMMTDPWGRKYWSVGVRVAVVRGPVIDKETKDAVVDAMMGKAVSADSGLKGMKSVAISAKCKDPKCRRGRSGTDILSSGKAGTGLDGAASSFGGATGGSGTGGGRVGGMSGRPAAPRASVKAIRVPKPALSVVLQSKLRRRLRAKTYALKHCYQRGLNKDPKLRGSVKIAFTVAKSGRVSKVTVTTSMTGEIKGCIKSRVLRWRLVPLPKSLSMTVSAKFQPKS